jgi:hypothetical protein
MLQFISLMREAREDRGAAKIVIVDKKHTIKA